MVKKGETTEGSVKKRITKAELEEMLIDNFVNLQRVLTDLSLKFDVLSMNISKLLELFEASAKSLAEKQGVSLPKLQDKNEPKFDKELLNKLDSLLDQNKTIARGLTLIEGKLRENVYSSNLNEPSSAPEEPQAGYTRYSGS
jgi:hypothetical protein